MKARVRSVRWEAQDILGFRLEPLPGAHLAPFTAGAHVDVALRPGLTRSYSLLNDPREHGAYEIAVQLDPARDTATAGAAIGRSLRARRRADRRAGPATASGRRRG